LNSDFVDCLSGLNEAVNDGRNARSRPTIAVVIEQAPFAGGCSLQCVDKLLSILGLKAQAASI
jgi:hypothetical protein